MPEHYASMRNLALARLKSPWLRPWRTAGEAVLLRRIVWQWEHHARTRGRMRFVGRPRLGAGKAEYPYCSGNGLARLLGVSHTTIQRLARSFNHAALQAEVQRCGTATLGQLFEAQAETRRQRAAGLLRQRLYFCKRTIDWRKSSKRERFGNEDYARYLQRIEAMRERCKAAAGPAAQDAPTAQPARHWDAQARSWRTIYPAGSPFMDRLTGAVR
jgi:hypothetical protein